MKQPSADLMLTPVMDLLSLLTIGFLTIGILGAVARGGTPATPPSPRPEAHVAQPAAGDPAALASLDAALRARAARLDELSQILSAPAEPRHGFGAGAPIVRPSRVAEKTFAVILTNGRVVPIEAPWIHAERTASGAVMVRPARSGLTVPEALRPGSPLTRAIAAPDFQRSGRVVLLVTADSFEAFRAVRAGLVRERVDFGWEPVVGSAITFGSGPQSRQVLSQAP